ncbi:MAG: hypothetical protein JWP01_3382 [Myxococcales bacterium]|nr:hypothetical protein [Myxococcales bacterium]
MNDRRERLDAARRARDLGYTNLANFILSRLAREVAADPDTTADIRAELDALIAKAKPLCP